MKRNGERQVATRIEDIRADHRARYDWAADRLTQDDNVLDAGCGVGYGTYTVAQIARSATGIDCDAETIAFAKENWGAENVSFECGNLHALGFSAAQRFSAVTAFEVIEHLVRPEIFLRSLRKFTSPEARIFASCPNEDMVEHTVNLNPFHICHYTRNSFVELMEKTGYEVLHVLTQDSGELRPLVDGRTIVLECVQKSNFSAPQITLEDALDALAAAEREVNKRAQRIRELQAKIRKFQQVSSSENRRP